MTAIWTALQNRGLAQQLAALPTSSSVAALLVLRLPEFRAASRANCSAFSYWPESAAIETSVSFCSPTGNTDQRYFAAAQRRTRPKPAVAASRSPTGTGKLVADTAECNPAARKSGPRASAGRGRCNPPRNCSGIRRRRRGSTRTHTAAHWQRVKVALCADNDARRLSRGEAAGRIRANGGDLPAISGTFNRKSPAKRQPKRVLSHRYSLHSPFKLNLKENAMHALYRAAKQRSSIAMGREPLETGVNNTKPQRGDSEFCRPVGASIVRPTNASRGLHPWLLSFGPLGLATLP
jgi:hypothetical protein